MPTPLRQKIVTELSNKVDELMILSSDLSLISLNLPVRTERGERQETSAFNYSTEFHKGHKVLNVKR
jgi:hypothetical protein